MTEDEARAWFEANVGSVAIERLERFDAIIRAEAERQNLVSPATLPLLWSRHFVDSAQLVRFAAAEGAWADIGAGAGFPGLVVAMLREAPISLIEPRGRRATFLRDVATELKLRWVEVIGSKAEVVSGTYAAISARAVASLPDLVRMSAHLRDRQSTLIFPRGRHGAAELETLPARWQRLFHVEQSITDPSSVILVGKGAS